MRNPIHSITKRLTRRRPFPLLVRRLGATWLLDPTNWIDTRIAAGVPYETPQLERMHRLVAEHRLDTLVDVGANIGFYTVLVGRRQDIDRVIAVEPVGRNFNQLLGNVFANRLDGKVEAYRVALGAADGEATIHIDPRSTGVSRLDLNASPRDTRVFTETERVTIRRFDDMTSLKGRRVFLKLDVEGHADAALSGMDRLFADNKVVAQVEVFADEEDAVDARMRDLGCRLFDRVGDDHYYVSGQR